MHSIDCPSPLLAIDIAHLAETPFGFCTSTFLPIPPQTPKHLGFGVFMPSKLRRDTSFGLKMPASWRNEKKNQKTFVPLISGSTDFYFSVVTFFGSSSQD
jgi:hypothetical protein